MAAYHDCCNIAVTLIDLQSSEISEKIVRASGNLEMGPRAFAAALDHLGTNH